MENLTNRFSVFNYCFVGNYFQRLTYTKEIALKWSYTISVLFYCVNPCVLKIGSLLFCLYIIFTFRYVYSLYCSVYVWSPKSTSIASWFLKNLILLSTFFERAYSVVEIEDLSTNWESYLNVRVIDRFYDKHH